MALEFVNMGLQALSGARGVNKANEAAARDYISKLDEVKSVNSQITETNLQNTIRTGYRVGILNVQRGAAKAEAVQMGYNVGAKAQQVLGASYANAAASGNVGSSVDAVTTDIQRKVDEAQLEVQDNYDTSNFNFDQQLNDIIQRGQDSLQTPYKVPKGPNYANALGAALSGAANAAVQYGMQYASANMSLGLGQRSTTPMMNIDVSAQSVAPTSNLGGSYLTSLKSS